jgi:RNA polymerase sigma-70 factor (ECF subfamily)
MNESEREVHDRFLRLFMALEPDLRVFVRSLLHSGEEELEVMQETAVVLWRKFDATMDDQAFARWAFGVARMEVLTFRRDRARDRHRFGDEVSELLAQSTLEHRETLQDERDAMELCVEKLLPEQRQLLADAYRSKTNINELAAAMGRSAMSLYKKLHRIRTNLLECVQSQLAKDGLS